MCFNDLATNASVVCYDAGYASNIIYNGYTIIIITNVTWTYGHTYYITIDSGFASGNVFCRKSLYIVFGNEILNFYRNFCKLKDAESAPITSQTYWQFNIWNPAVSSTTTTTTTPPTTHTVTTRVR